MINYLALLGWGYDEIDDLLHHRRAAEALLAGAGVQEPGRLRRAEAALDERPLPAGAAVDDLTARLEEFTGRTGLDGAVAITQEKISTLDEFWPLAGSFFDGPADDPKAREKFLDARESREALEDVARGAGGAAGAVDRRPTSRKACARSSSGTGGRPSRSSSHYGSL